MTRIPTPNRRRTEPARRLAGDERGVSEIIGAILLFGLVLLLLVVVQATAVPVWNQQTEFEHSQRVGEDWQEFDAATADVAADGTERTVVVETGVRYPPRPFLINPPPASGSIETLPPGTLVIENADIDDDVDNGYWSSTEEFETSALRYRPDYSEYRNGPTTVYETGMLHNQYSDATVVLDGGNVVEGRSVNLQMLDGEYSAARSGPTSLAVEPTSAPTRTVQIADSGGPIVLRLPTLLDEETIREEVFADECDEPDCVDSGTDLRPDRYVQSVTVTPGSPYNTAVITLEPGVSYSLTMSEVAVGNADREEAAYVARTGAENLLVGAPSNTDLTAEVRDRYNNPVAGETVTFQVANPANGTLSDATVETGPDGRATVTYTAPSVNSTNTVTASIDGGTAPPTQVAWNVEADTRIGVGGASGPGGAGPEDAVSSVNPGENDFVPYIAGTDAGGGGIDICFANDADNPWTFSQSRISLYFSSGGSPNTATVSSTGGSGDSTLTIGGSYEDTSGSVGTIGANSAETVTFDFSGGSASGNQFFVLSIEFTDGARLRTMSYIVSVTDSGTC